jgi:hypothetical protein
MNQERIRTMDSYEQMTKAELEKACDEATALCKQAQDRGDEAEWSRAAEELGMIKERLAVLRCPFTGGEEVRVRKGDKIFLGIVEYLESDEDVMSPYIWCRVELTGSTDS